MAAEQSAEAKALDAATQALEAELAEVGTVDGEVVVDLEGIKAAISKVGPVSLEQVNAVTAVVSSLASLTAKLKAAGTNAAGVEAAAGPAGAQAPAAAGGAGASGGAAASASSAAPGAAAGGGAEASAAAPKAQAVYTWDASVGVENAEFTVVPGVRTPGDATPPHAPLFHFSGDPADGSAANGASVAGYVQFTGTPEAVPAQ